MNDEESVSTGAQRRPRQIWTAAGITSAAATNAVPNGAAWVATSVNLFFHGGPSGALITLSDTQSTAAFVTWRPETANDQSLYWQGWQVFYAGQSITANVFGGDFDVMIGGWEYPYQYP